VTSTLLSAIVLRGVVSGNTSNPFISQHCYSKMPTRLCSHGDQPCREFLPGPNPLVDYVGQDQSVTDLVG